MALEHVDSVQLVHLNRFSDVNGTLVVVQGQRDVAFSIARVFTVQAEVGALRGDHAHKRCVQFLVAVSGSIEVLCDDGSGRRSFTLDRGDVGLLLPPSIWATQIFRRPFSVLLVLCDQPYDEDDYIRDRDVYLSWRRDGGLAQ